MSDQKPDGEKTGSRAEGAPGSRAEGAPGSRAEGAPEEVRLISRDEAEDAIRSGEAITRNQRQRGVDGAQVDLSETSESPVVTVTQAHETLDLRFAEQEATAYDDLPEESGDISRVTSASLPHWTEPPTGEVPKMFADEPPEESASKWRSSHETWKPEGEQDLSDLGKASELGEAVKGQDGENSEEQAGEGSLSGRRFRESTDHTTAADAAKTERRAVDSVSLVKRIATGAVFAIAALFAFAAGPPWILTLCAVVLLLATIEYFDGLRRVGFKPATLLALLAVAGCLLGGYARGEQALPLVLGVSVLFTFLWYLTGIIKESPTANIAVTLLGIVWIGVLGSYAALLLRQPDGVAFLLGAVLVTIAYDTAAYAGGTIFGKHKMAPSISPSKTWEGLAAGTAAAVVVGALGVSIMSPWSVVDAALLGLVVAFVAPIGDLAESLIKRDLGIKDMGRILPGHGGVLDRFDALNLVLPATYYLVLLLNV